MTNRHLIALLIIVLGAALGYVVWTQRDFKLGLDLRGGSHLVYQADATQLAPGTDIDQAMEALRSVIERRINAFGVAEPVIQTEKVGFGANRQDRLIVELPGVTDLTEATKAIKATPLLEFRTQRPDGPEKAAILAAWEAAQEQVTKGETVAENPLLQQDPLFIPTALTGRFLKPGKAQVQFASGNVSPSISLEFDAEGTKLFAELTKANIGKPVGIYLDGQLISAPVVREEIKDGKPEITGQFTLEDARNLARNLNLGALPIPIQLVSTQTIGAALGDDALARGIKAGMIGFIAVAIFMILWYRLPGVVAVVALSLYVIIMLAIFKFLPVTLTAAGIAGFILSVGMAVDANILIFERLKEEMKKTTSLEEAINHGFARAWFSIRDSNLSSIISALILFWFGTSLVKGFALTLLIGVLVSMLSAITITRTLLRALGAKQVSRVNRFLFGSGLF
jgi:protein-export membrane protein SecD